MLGMPTLGVGISWPRNGAEAPFQGGKYFQAAACFTQKRQLFLHLPPQSCKTHLKLLCPRIFETVQMVLSETVAKARLFHVISRSEGCTFEEALYDATQIALPSPYSRIGRRQCYLYPLFMQLPFPKVS